MVYNIFDVNNDLNDYGNLHNVLWVQGRGEMWNLLLQLNDSSGRSINKNNQNEK